MYFVVLYFPSKEFWFKKSLKLPTIGAVRVLQTETSLVPFSDPRAVQSQQVIMREHFNAVVVPEYTGREVVEG